MPGEKKLAAENKFAPINQATKYFSKEGHVYVAWITQHGTQEVRELIPSSVEYQTALKAITR